jgi:hypothetical protein
MLPFTEGEIKIDDHSKKRVYIFQARALNHSAISPKPINRYSQLYETRDFGILIL